MLIPPKAGFYNYMSHHKNSGSFKKGQIPWNKGKRELQIAWNKGRKMPEISGINSPHWKDDNVGISGVHYWVKKYLFKPDKCNRCKKITKVLDLSNNSGKYLRDLSDWEYICKSCHRLKDKMSQGEKNGRAKLTEKQVLEIRQKYIPWKYSTTKLAKEYNITNQLIGMIICKKSWKHI